MLKRELLLTGCAIVLALSGHEANAAEACTAVPTCAELGYTETTCNGFVSLKCPFDKTKLFCGSDRCETDYSYNSGKCVKINPNIIYADGKAIGVKVNEHLAVAMTDEGLITWDAAVAKCKAKTTGGKSWHLPTKDELLAINKNYQSISNTLSVSGGHEFGGYYWSSTEASSDVAWRVSPLDGTSLYNEKPYNHPARCVFDL